MREQVEYCRHVCLRTADKVLIDGRVLTPQFRNSPTVFPLASVDNSWLHDLLQSAAVPPAPETTRSCATSYASVFFCSRNPGMPCKIWRGFFELVVQHVQSLNSCEAPVEDSLSKMCVRLRSVAKSTTVLDMGPGPQAVISKPNMIFQKCHPKNKNLRRLLSVGFSTSEQ